jgi:hypothetical protein
VNIGMNPSTRVVGEVQLKRDLPLVDRPDSNVDPVDMNMGRFEAERAILVMGARNFVPSPCI